jgi:hypothetical protein
MGVMPMIGGWRCLPHRSGWPARAGHAIGNGKNFAAAILDE